MRVLLAVFLFLLSVPAKATTYTYFGNSIDVTTCSLAPSCPVTSTTKITASVTFLEDTSHFTGTLSLADATSAFLAGLGGAYSYPFTIPPLNVYALVSTMTGVFILQDGSIVDWNVSGNTFQQNCGGGPGCAAGFANSSTTPTSDGGSYSGYFQYSSGRNDGGGFWLAENIAAIPEPSTWSMMLLGFAGIGFIARRQKSSSIIRRRNLVSAS